MFNFETTLALRDAYSRFGIVEVGYSAPSPRPPASPAQMFCTAYAAAKFGIEGWMESLTPEIATFGIRTMLVEPAFFRTELLSNDSTTYAQPTIDGYAERTKAIVAAWKSMNGKQGGDPAKLAEALVTLVGLKEPPALFAAGADAVETFEANANTLLAQAHAHRDLSAPLAHDDA